MVDSISSNPNNINELSLGQLNQSQQLERLNRESADSSNTANVLPFGENVDISDAAYAKLQSEKDLSKFASLAQRMDESFDADKVNAFKTMLDSGRINDYLRGFSNEDLADSLLNSSTRASFI